MLRSALAVTIVALIAAVPLWAGPALAATVTVPAGDTYFCDPSFFNGVCPTEVNEGDTVVWDYSGASLSHTTTECGASCSSPTSSPLWNSGVINGGTFQFTFTQAGTFNYYCQVHGTQMGGQIIVNEAAPPLAQPTATPLPGQPTSGPQPTAAQPSGATPAAVRGAPAAGGGPGVDGGSGGATAIVAATLAGLTAAGGGIWWLRRRP